MDSLAVGTGVDAKNPHRRGKRSEGPVAVTGTTFIPVLVSCFPITRFAERAMGDAAYVREPTGDTTNAFDMPEL
jgi:hypothetical protein